MNIKHIIAGVLALAAIPAMATPPAISDTPTNVLFIAGSSALQNFIQARIQSNANAGDCLTLTEDTTTGGVASNSNSNYVAYFCTGNASSGAVTTANPLPKVLYYYTKKGGSYNGVVPVSQQLAVPHLNLSSSACRLVSGTTYACTVGAATDAPCVGASDLESTAFVGNNVAAGAAGYNAASNKTGYTSSCPIFQSFGIGVNNNFYVALQVVQGLKVAAGGVGQSPAVGAPTSGYAVGDPCQAARPGTYTNTAGVITFTATGAAEPDYVDNSCRPNLNGAWLAALNADKIVTPDALHVPSGTGTLGSGTYDAAQYVYWVHRGAGSGTQAGFNGVFANTPFAPSVAQVTSPFAGGTQRLNTAGYACGSTGDVKTLLSGGAAPTSCTSGTANEQTLATLPIPGTAFAVGIVGQDNQPKKSIGGTHTGDDGFQFVKLSGANPENPYDAATASTFTNYADIADGLYPYIFGSCFNTTTTNTAAVCDSAVRTNFVGDLASATTQSLICGVAANNPLTPPALSSNGLFCTPDSAACTAATPAARCLNITRDGASGEPIRINK
jgi:hypothetical protein